MFWISWKHRDSPAGEDLGRVIFLVHRCGAPDGEQNWNGAGRQELAGIVPHRRSANQGAAAHNKMGGSRRGAIVKISLKYSLQRLNIHSRG